MDSFRYSAQEVLNLIWTKKDDFWSRERERRPLELFHEAARRVPAYKDFLKKNKVNPAKVRTFADFQHVPPIDKKGYLRKYPLEKLCWDGTLKRPLVFTSTSGSTGEPFYFPRGEKLDWEASIIHEMFFRNSSHGIEGPTLVVVCFGMGVWIAGLITYKAFEIPSRREGYEVSLITTGINKVEVFKVLKKITPYYRQIILTGYPPFIKDIIDEARSEGINLKKMNVRIMFAAEAFTEKFRDHLVKNAHIKNAYLDTLNIYGTADIGAMAFETPTAILIRRLAVRKQAVFSRIFSNINKTPTLAQYNPLFTTFEAPQGKILITGDNTIPFIRYSLGDNGGVYSFGEIWNKLTEEKIQLDKEAKKVGIGKCLYELPFIYVFERSDLSTTLYGLQIYPETIREALLAKKLNKFLSGKFTMLTKFDGKQNQYLELHLELRKDKKPHKKLIRHALKEIIMNLRVKNSEFRELHDYLKDRALPKLTLWPSGHPLHFQAGIKQKWVKK